MEASRGRNPSSGTSILAMASRISPAWRAEPTRLQITPARLSSGSRLAKPLTTAATLSAAERTSTTSKTGRPSVLARWAAEPSPPSKRPITPSTTAMPASAGPGGWWRANEARTKDSPHMRTSRLRETRPLTISCRLGSMKSGPHLKGRTARPRRRNAAISPRVIVVLPQPEWVPAMSRAGAAFIARPAPPEQNPGKAASG